MLITQSRSMERKIDGTLAEWKARQGHKALMIRGPRQIGKSYSIRKFGEKNYRRVLEINFEDEPRFRTVFADDLSADKIFLSLSYVLEDIDSFEGCLLFLDEIQACEGAISALKPLTIDGRCDIICSGSQLGNTIGVSRLTPLGYVETMRMEPMDFEEFLWALGFSHSRTAQIGECIRSMTPFDRPILRKLNDLYLRYVTIGGMPEAVKAFADSGLYSESYQVQTSIITLLKEDILRYGESPTDKDRISQCLKSIPEQLSRESGSTFRYSDVSLKSGYGRREFGPALSWLENAGVIILCRNLEEISEPFRTKTDGNLFKVYMRDTGILTSMLGPAIGKGLIDGDYKINNGALIEDAVSSALIKKGYGTFYYSNPAKRMEIDFVVNLNGKIAAIEVKSGRKKSARSLNKLAESGQHADILIKVSDSNLSIDENGVYHMPFFGPSFFDECHPLEPSKSDYSDLLDDSIPLTKASRKEADGTSG